MGDGYRRFRIASSDAAMREQLLAEAFESGAEGAEERDEPAREGLPARALAEVYARAEEVEGVRAAVIDAAAAAGARVEVGPAEALEPVDWSEAWKAGLGPIVISPRLVVRPPFAPHALAPGQVEIVIDPGQAFGTGTHASTRLCLEWLDRLLADAGGRARHDRLLDVGTGSGVLALAAVALGAAHATGFDLDPLATEAALEAARINGLAGRTRFRTAPIEAIPGAPGFPLIVANLLKRELLPIAGAIARRLSPAGSLILAGLLEEDGDEVAARFARFGLVEVERRSLDDAVGRWIAPRYAFDPPASASA